MPWDDVNFFSPQFLHHVLNATAFHAHAGTDGIYIGVIRSHGDFGAYTGFPGSPHDINDAFAYFRYFGSEKIHQEVRMGPGKNNLRTARFVQHVKDISAYAIPAPIGFPRNLFTNRKHPIGVSQVYDNIASIDPLNDAVKDFSFAADETGIDDIFFGIFHFLDNDLFGRLGGYASEGAGIHLGTQAVANLTFGIQLATLREADFNLRFSDDLGDLFKLKDFDLTAFFIVLNFDIHLVAVLFPGGRSQSLFQRLDKDFAINALIPANLFYDTFYV